MPIYMDRHAVENATPERLAEDHRADLEVQSDFGVDCFTYWFDQQRQSVFCLMEAPSREAVQDMHRASHGQVASEIIEVDPAVVAAFLGRTRDPVGVEREPVREPAFRVIMFTDMANSTDITRQLGDDAAFELLQTHNGIIRSALRAQGGREVDRAGDGFLSSFASVARAVECAISIQQSFRAHNGANAEIPIRVRIGLGAGEPVADGDTLFGSTVNLTARICARAQPEQILVASVVRDLCVGKPFSFKEHGEVELRGFPEPVRLHEVDWL
jgi:class 3 adenylate cyclase